MEKLKLNTTDIYILSGVGLLCCCLSGLGFIPAGIALYLAINKLKEYNANPEDYENPKPMQTAKTIAMVVLIINLAYLAYTIYILSTTEWDVLMEQSRQMMEEIGMEQPE